MCPKPTCRVGTSCMTLLLGGRGPYGPHICSLKVPLQVAHWGIIEEREIGGGGDEK